LTNRWWQEGKSIIKVKVENVYKIFGRNPDLAIELIQQGATKDEIQDSTGSVVGLDNVSFAVEAGEVFVVMGLSGSGKSTLVRCINRLIPPTSGQIYVDGEDILALSQEGLRALRRTKISMVFQRFALFPHKTVVENAAFGLKVRGMAKKERQQLAHETLEMVGLGAWANYYPRNLSGGMQQRVGLARALTTDPDILLMDEPFGALDPLIRREIQEELIQLQRSVNKTIIFITHDLHEALKLGDRIAIMKDGHFVQVGTPEQIVSQPADDYVAAFIQDVDLGRVITAGFISHPVVPLPMQRDNAADVLRQLDASGAAALHVINDDGRPLGLITRQDLRQQGDQPLDKLMRTEFPLAQAKWELADLYQLCAEGVPVAVVDGDGRYQGVVHYQDVLAALAANNGGPALNGQPNYQPNTTTETAASQPSPLSKQPAI
jgi:glycine betaine/proline transport system ATP-binding protein